MRWLPWKGSRMLAPGETLSITHKFSTDADAQLNINEAS
jgi:hypothetical protein